MSSIIYKKKWPNLPTYKANLRKHLITDVIRNWSELTNNKKCKTLACVCVCVCARNIKQAMIYIFNLTWIIRSMEFAKAQFLAKLGNNSLSAIRSSNVLSVFSHFFSSSNSSWLIEKGLLDSISYMDRIKINISIFTTTTTKFTFIWWPILFSLDPYFIKDSRYIFD